MSTFVLYHDRGPTYAVEPKPPWRPLMVIAFGETRDASDWLKVHTEDRIATPEEVALHWARRTLIEWQVFDEGKGTHIVELAKRLAEHAPV